MPTAPNYGSAKRIALNTIQFECNEGFVLPPNQLNVSHCVRMEWDSNVPICERACGQLKGTTFRLKDCHSNGNQINCDQPMPIGSIATSVCRDAYEGRGPSGHTCQSDGSWSPAPTRCRGRCGRIPNPPHIPWHIGFYDTTDSSNVRWVCSGTLVTDRTILTSQTCLQGIAYKNLKAIAGKIQRDFDADADTAQTRTVVQIYTDSRPTDQRDKDLGIVIVDEAFAFDGINVAPICHEYSMGGINHAALHSPIGVTGVVPAWRLTGGALEQIRFDLLNPIECHLGGPTITNRMCLGKICSKRPSNDDAPNCAQITGSGLVIPRNQNGEHVFYIYGIATWELTSPEGCANYEHYLFSNPAYYQGEILHYGRLNYVL